MANSRTQRLELPNGVLGLFTLYPASIIMIEQLQL